jgi:hypothetical protein
LSQLIQCPRCGGELIPGDRFCGECGFDTGQQVQQVASPEPVRPAAGTGEAISPPVSPPVTHPEPVFPQQSVTRFDPAQGNRGLGAAPSRSGGTGPIIIVVGLILVLLAGGGLFWWLSKGEEPPQVAAPQTNQPQQSASTPAGSSTNQPSAQLDLTRAATYLSESGLKCSFFVNYPDGFSGTVERVSARVVPAEAVRVSEAEIIQDSGEVIGYGFHYIERPDGIYLIYDSTPQECSPVLKNNLTVGQSWNYVTEFGQIVWTVLDMGVSLDLGFATLDNCLLIEEDNQAVGFKTIIYYAPGMGQVVERTSQEGGDLSKLTAFSKIDAAQAAETVKKWSPNYPSIQDDRTQN